MPEKKNIKEEPNRNGIYCTKCERYMETDELSEDGGVHKECGTMVHCVMIAPSVTDQTKKGKYLCSECDSSYDSYEIGCPKCSGPKDSPMIQKLKEVLKNTPLEVLKKEWEEIEKDAPDSPNAYEYMESLPPIPDEQQSEKALRDTLSNYLANTHVGVMDDIDNYAELHALSKVKEREQEMMTHMVVTLQALKLKYLAPKGDESNWLPIPSDEIDKLIDLIQSK